MGIMEMAKFLANKGAYLAGRVYRFVIRRPIQRYNVENRTFRLLDKHESGTKLLKPAPKVPSTEKYLKQLEKEHPEVLDEIKAKPKELLEHLNRVKVVSDKAGITSSEQFKRDKSKLPVLTRARRTPEYGIQMPDHVPAGKVTLDLYIKVLDERYYNPDIWTNKYVSEQFNIDEDHVRMVTEHFRPFKVYKYEHEHVPWHSPRKMEMLILGIVTPSTWQTYYEEEIKKLEAGEQHQKFLQEELERGRRERFLAYQEQQKKLAQKEETKLISNSSSNDNGIDEVRSNDGGEQIDQKTDDTSQKPKSTT